MKRRSMVAVAAGNALYPWLSALAQAQRMKRIGWLDGRPAQNPGSMAIWQGIVEELRRFGWEEERNVIIDRRFSLGDPTKHFSNAEELAAAHVDVIVVFGHQGLEQAYKATKSVPIVTMASGLVEFGYAKSLAHPGGNVTGVDFHGLEFIKKHFQLLYMTRPGLKKVGFSGAPGPSSDIGIATLQDAARSEGVAVVRLPNVADIADIEPMLIAAKRDGVQALTLAGEMAFLRGTGLQRIQAWATENNVLTSSPNWQVGQLLFTYGPNFPEVRRVAMSAVDRILRGAKPADIPIQHPSTFNITINMKIAKAMGLSIPQTVLLQATEIVQ